MSSSIADLGLADSLGLVTKSTVTSIGVPFASGDAAFAIAPAGESFESETREPLLLRILRILSGINGTALLASLPMLKDGVAGRDPDVSELASLLTVEPDLVAAAFAANCGWVMRQL